MKILKYRRWLGLIGIFALLGGVGLYAGFRMGFHGQRGDAAELAPDFRVALYQGQGPDGGSEVHLSDYRGRPVVVNFWAVWCPPCRAEMPALEQTYRQFEKQGLVVIGVDFGPFSGRSGGEEEALEFVKGVGVTYPIGRPQNAEVVNEYDVQWLPAGFLVGRDGTIQWKWNGAIDQETLVTRVEDIVVRKVAR